MPRRAGHQSRTGPRAHQNLSAILAATDPAGARGHRDAAYRRQQVFIDAAPSPERTVLVLAAADAANVPLQHLMPPARTTLIRWYVEYATPEQDRALPPFDVVFNAIGEAELAPALGPPVLRLLQRCGPRVINPPDSIAQTRRVNLPRLLAGIEGVVVPPVVPLGPDLPARMAVAAMQFPVLVRPVGTHGGEGVRRIKDAMGLAELAETAGTVTQFVDFASPDGWHRKYRMVFVDGGMFPYHLAISRHWLVHHWTTGMEHDAARRAEEARFLVGPACRARLRCHDGAGAHRRAAGAGLWRGGFFAAAGRARRGVRSECNHAGAPRGGCGLRLPQSGDGAHPGGVHAPARGTQPLTEATGRCMRAGLAGRPRAKQESTQLPAEVGYTSPGGSLVPSWLVRRPRRRAAKRRESA